MSFMININQMINQQKKVEGTVVEETVDEGPLIERTLVEKSTNEKMVVEVSVAEDMVKRKLELINQQLNDQKLKSYKFDLQTVSCFPFQQFSESWNLTVWALIH